MSLTPFVPPRSTDLPACGGVIGPSPAHFVVEEIPAYPLSGQGEHLFLLVEKTGLNTADVARRIADKIGAKARDVGFAGMKDKNAVTRQWFSICTKADAASWDLGEGTQVLEVTRHDNKLRTGHLIGNRFTLTLVNAPPSALAGAEAIAARLKESGLPNYFGPQRFGIGGRNLSSAVDWLRQEMSGPAPREERARRKKSRRGDQQRFENKLFPSVLQSEFFNRYTHARLAREEPLLSGEVVRLNGAGKCFVVKDLNVETPRKVSGDLHLTGPMPGPKTLKAEEDALALELQIWESLGLEDGALEVLGRSAPGTRRDLLVHPEALTVKDGLEPGQYCLSFSLPAGGYATNVAFEFTGGDWNQPRPEKSAA